MSLPNSGKVSAFSGQLVSTEEVDDDGEEDFYGLNTANATNGNRKLVTGSSERLSTNGLPSVNVNSGRVILDKTIETDGQPTKSDAEQRKAEHQKKAADLRAKLIAQRQSTPAKATAGPNTPSKVTPTAQEELKSASVKHDMQPVQNEPSNDVFGLESLLAEGKAAAETKLKENALPASEVNVIPSNGESPNAVPGAEDSGQNQHSIQNTSEKAIQGTETPTTSNKPTQGTEGRLVALTDAYYDDLPIWLEVTGYHDVEYRNSRLRTYKERKALEEEAARIAARLEKLKQDEQLEIALLRASTRSPTTVTKLFRPALPDVIPAGDINQNSFISKPSGPAPAANGTKRAHSPDPALSEKSSRRREEPTEFSIRGANGSTASQLTSARRTYSPSSAALERRISYPEARRRSDEDFSRTGANKEARDPSLERRQAYYKRDSASMAHFSLDSRDNRFERPESANYNGTGRYEDGSRANHNSPERFSGASGYRASPQARGSSGLDFKRGGVRYFMIKSWNYDNVDTAMRDGLWATQEKNEDILTEAYRTSRHVVLLFSVNKSMMFQGYALMTSPPDPNLPKPSFCTKLNWKTSPAFTLRWLATEPVHFRTVGHLKNPLNLDENGQPTAVLVGKDGQEISPEAGLGVVSMLEEAEDRETRKRSNASTSSK